MDIQIKIKEYIKSQKISFREFAKMCGLPNSTLQSICERGIYSASFQNATKIANVLGVSVGDFASSPCDFAVSKEETQFIEKLRKLDSRGKESVFAILNHEYKSCNVSDGVLQFVSQSKKSADYIEISKREIKKRMLKVYLQPAAAGTGNYLDDEYFEECEFENPPKKADFAIRIAGDSMEPKIQNGDVVFVQKCESIANGEVGIYVIDGDAFCKKLAVKDDGAYLHSFNPKYADFILPESAYLVGKVIL